MALRSLRLTSYLRRATKFSASVLRHNPLIQPEPDSFRSSAIISPSFSSRINRPFTSTTSLFRKIFDPDTDEIGPDTILFEGCDYNHWLITMDFPKDNPPTREQMIETYVNTAAQVFGSVEEAKKKIYALSTTTYQGFQVECSEETSNKFQQLPGVVFVLPDSYIDPVNKEYGGDKYVNGEIFPRPPPVHYGRRTDRRRERNYGPPQQNYPYQSTQQNHSSQQQHYQSLPPQQQNPPQQANYRPPAQQGYSPTPQQNYAPSQQQNFGPPQQQSYTSHQPQNFSPPQQHYGAAQQPTYGQPPPKNYGSPPQWNYNPSQPPRPNYGAHPQPTYGGHQQQNYPPQAQQGYGFPPQQHGHVPPQQPSYEPPNQSYRPSVERNQDPPQVPHAQGSEPEGFKLGGN